MMTRSRVKYLFRSFANSVFQCSSRSVGEKFMNMSSSSEFYCTRPTNNYWCFNYFFILHKQVNSRKNSDWKTLSVSPVLNECDREIKWHNLSPFLFFFSQIGVVLERSFLAVRVVLRYTPSTATRRNFSLSRQTREV